MSNIQKFKELLNNNKEGPSKEEIKDIWRTDIADLYTSITNWLEEEDVKHAIIPTGFKDETIGDYYSYIISIKVGDVKAEIAPKYTTIGSHLDGAVALTSGRREAKKVEMILRQTGGDKVRWNLREIANRHGAELTKDGFFGLLIRVLRLEE